jgi:excisionase family DNA binding protein
MEHRFLARVRLNGTSSARERLTAAPEWLSVRQVAVVLGCSKSTVRKQIQLGLLKAPQSRKRQARQRLRVPSESVRKFLYFCERMRGFLLYTPLAAPGRGNVLDRIRRRGLPMPYRSMPKTMAVSDAAAVLECSRASVLRLIHSGQLKAIRITPCRWRVLKESFRGLREAIST